MGKASKWFSKMTSCIFGFKKVKKNAQNSSSSCKEHKKSSGDQIPASLVPQGRYNLHKERAREVAAAIAAAELAAASIAEAALAIARARVSFSRGGGGKTAAAVKIQRTFRGYLVRKQLSKISSDKIRVSVDPIALPQRPRLINKHAAATKIQKVYRGHLARRAFRALKSLVKVQALFRGRRVRKIIAAVCVRALIRARANAPVPANYMSPTMSSKAKLRPAASLKKEERPGTGEKKQPYLLYVEKMASRFSFSDCEDHIHFRDAMMASRPSFSEVRLHKRSRSQF